MRLRGSNGDVPGPVAEAGPYAVLEALPAAVLLMNARGEVVHRNAAALAHAKEVTAAHGEAMLLRMRERVQRIALEEKVFPVRQVVEVTDGGRNAEAEMVVNKLGTTHYVAVWNDITKERDTVRITEEIAGELTGAASTFAQLGDRLMGDADRVSTGSSSVAAAAEQMTSSISEIASSASAAVTETETAVDAAKQTSQRLEKLAQSSARIGAISNLIRSIAEQTNLLALNATIEAARAGDAGKGFAVVAGEVKDLASRTATATSEIGDMIAAIQQDSADAEASIADISNAIGEVQRRQTTVAGAVEQQTATAQEISSSMSAVADAAASASRAAGELRESADFISEKSSRLTGLFVR